MILEHVLDFQVFNADNLVFVDQVRGELLLEITTNVRDSFIDASDANALLFTIV